MGLRYSYYGLMYYISLEWSTKDSDHGIVSLDTDIILLKLCFLFLFLNAVSMLGTDNRRTCSVYLKVHL